MNTCNFRINGSEKAEFLLRNLFENYGFSQFKMSKFEEYDLYVRNKDFLISDGIITFTDTNGKLLAMKPDVTLSIIKNFREEGKYVSKVFYDENVYRVSDRSGGFKEIKQIGIESMGCVGQYDIYEVLLLAAKSLRIFSDRSVLDLSHFGLLSDVIHSLGIDNETKKSIFEAVGKKNLHEIRDITKKCLVPENKTELLCTLVSTYGHFDSVMPKLISTFRNTVFFDQVAFLNDLYLSLSQEGFGDMINLDFSVVNHTDYYNGIVFKGFVEGVPSGILSGGQYDRLMEKMGCRGGAIGFAVYLDALQGILSEKKEYDVDAVLLYSDIDSVSHVEKAVKALREEFETVVCQKVIPKKLRYRKLFELCDSGVKSVE